MPLTVDLPAQKPRSRAEQLADDLASRLVGGPLRPGERIGTLEELRARTGYARTTVSEAVRLLRERGVLEIRPGRGGGLFLAEDSVVVRMRRTLLDLPDSPVTVLEAIELREALEETVALGAAKQCGPEDAARLRSAVVALAEADHDYEEFLRRNWALHEQLAALCANSMVRAVYGSCLGSLRQGRARYDQGGSPAAYIAERARVHEELVEAVIAHDQGRIRAAVARHNTTPDAGDPSERHP